MARDTCDTSADPIVEQLMQKSHQELMHRPSVRKQDHAIDAARLDMVRALQVYVPPVRIDSPSHSASASVGASTVSDALSGFGLVSVMRIFKLVERSSGLCLFTTQWKWHPHAHAEGVDALVQSLAQFAREIDGGDVVRVHFDSHTSRSSSNSIGNGNGNGSATSIGSATNGNSTGNGNTTPTHLKPSEDDRRTSSVTDTNALEMLAHSSEHVQAVLFHDRISEVATQRLRLFVEQALDRFLQLHLGDVIKQQPALLAAHQATLTPEQTEELVAPFASFGDVLQSELLPTL